MGRRNSTSVEQALAASVAANRDLRAELDAAEKKLAATQAQLEFHQTQLRETKVTLGLKEETVERQTRRIDSLIHRLKVEREHTAGSCSHAADVRDLKGTLTALERRVAELQRVNESYEAPGWLPPVDAPAALPSAPSRLALGRKRGA